MHQRFKEEIQRLGQNLVRVDLPEPGQVVGQRYQVFDFGDAALMKKRAMAQLAV